MFRIGGEPKVFPWFFLIWEPFTAQSQDKLDGVCDWSEMCLTVCNDWCEKKKWLGVKGRDEHTLMSFFVQSNRPLNKNA